MRGKRSPAGDASGRTLRDGEFHDKASKETEGDGRELIRDGWQIRFRELVRSHGRDLVHWQANLFEVITSHLHLSYIVQ